MDNLINFIQNLYFSTMKIFQIAFLFFLISCGNEIIEKRPNPREVKDTVQLDKAEINDLNLGDSIRAVINHAKWQSAMAYCKMQGFTFRVITEDDLFRNGTRK